MPGYAKRHTDMERLRGASINASNACYVKCGELVICVRGMAAYCEHGITPPHTPTPHHIIPASQNRFSFIFQKSSKRFYFFFFFFYYLEHTF